MRKEQISVSLNFNCVSIRIIKRNSTFCPFLCFFYRNNFQNLVTKSLGYESADEQAKNFACQNLRLQDLTFSYVQKSVEILEKQIPFGKL